MVIVKVIYLCRRTATKISKINKHKLNLTSDLSILTLPQLFNGQSSFELNVYIIT